MNREDRFIQYPEELKFLEGVDRPKSKWDKPNKSEITDLKRRQLRAKRKKKNK